MARQTLTLEARYHEYQRLKESLHREKQNLLEAQEELRNTLKAQKCLQELAEQIQVQAHERIASLVTRCLQAIFGNEFTFQIDFVQRRGKTEADLHLYQGEVKLDPLESSAGGIVDVIAFALRLAALILSQPSKRRLLVLDENFKHLSSEYRPAVRDLLELLAEELGIQFILVSHSQELQIGKIVEI